MFKTGLVLGGGGTRGFAHIGALKAMEEAGIRADVVSGSSVGSIVGSMYADGMPADRMLEIFSNNTVFRLSRPAFFKRGLLGFGGLKKQVCKQLKAVTFEELEIPLYVCVANITAGRAEYIHEGLLAEAVTASASIPILYHPVRMGNDLYADGGVFDNFPVKPIRKQCKRIIGINIMPRGTSTKMKGVIGAGKRVFQLYMNEADSGKWKQADVLIEPPELADFGYLGHRHGPEMYRLGYEAAKKVL